MARKSLRTLKVDELATDFGTVKGLEVTIGRVIEEAWTAPVGPNAFPSVTDLRNWDLRLLKRYKPLYAPFSDVCDFCTYGKCDLTKGKRGACGIDLRTQTSRRALLTAVIGASTHAGHARHLVSHLIEKYGRDHPIDLGNLIDVEAPIIRTVCGIRPRVLEDLEIALDYVEEQITHLLAATATGQEGDHLDFESKILHAGMIDSVAMEAADLAQISAYGFPRGDPEAPLAEIGFGTVDIKKPVIMCVGHNVAPGHEIMGYLKRNDLEKRVEVCGLCCTAHDLTRHSDHAKIVGPISQQLRFIRSGVADVMVLDEQCIRTDSLIEARRVKAPVIATSDKMCLGLPDRTADPTDEIVEDLMSGRMPGVLILDPDKIGEVAPQVAIQVAPKRKKFKVIPSKAELISMAKRCNLCGRCREACGIDLAIDEATHAAGRGDLAPLANLYEYCVGCARCEYACPLNLPLLSMMEKAAEKRLKEERYRIRVGRGPILDTEIREVGAPIVLGEIPGVIAFAGCANYPHGGREVAEMCEEFIKRKYIVVSSGCSAMSIALCRNGEGKTLYEAYPGAFDASCLANTGSCVSNAHIIGSAIKIAAIFARRNLRSNYEEIADYITNRVGAAGIIWGTMSQKAFAIAAGACRLGIPIILGPQGWKYGRLLLGRKENKKDWYAYDARTGKEMYIGPAPEHLYYAAESKEEAMVMATKLCMRPNDTTKGRAIKITNYVDLHKRFYGTLPDDLHTLVRTKADVPITMKDEILKALKESKWKEGRIIDPTLLHRLVRKG